MPENATVTLTLPDGTVETSELQPDGWIVLTGPNRHVTHEQHYPQKGTVVVTIKRTTGDGA